MRSVAFVNRRSQLRSLRDLPQTRFLVLEDHAEARRIRQLLLKSGAAEIDRAELYRREGRTFRDKYVDFLGSLNIENASFEWWSFNLTSKNYFVNDLCKQVFYASVICPLATQNRENLVVITDDRHLANYAEKFLGFQGHRVSNRVRTRMMEFVRSATPLGIVYCLLCKLRTTWLSRRLFPRKDWVHRADCLILTLLNHQSFDPSGGYRDTYFGPLRNDLQNESLATVTVGAVFNHDAATVRMLRSCSNGDMLPLDAFTPIGELMVWAFRCVSLYFQKPRIKGNTTFDGIEVRPLIAACMKREIGTGNCLLNVWFYLSAGALANRIQSRTVLYPFENRSWEKMLVLAFRNRGGSLRLIGYQHASITPRHSSLFFSEHEWDATPLPDAVVTTGEIPRRILIKVGRYPEVRVCAGVALRQPPGRGVLREGKDVLRRILVILSSSVDEYVKSLLLLNDAFRDNNHYEVIIRNHPTIPLSGALNVLGPIEFDFKNSSGKSAAEDLQQCDVVFYSSSSVALEALALGIPVVYLDLGDFMDPDPLFDFSDFKWSVTRAAEVIPVLEEINGVAASDLQKRRLLAQAYALSYVRPADKAGMKEFLDVVLARLGCSEAYEVS